MPENPCPVETELRRRLHERLNDIRRDFHTPHEVENLQQQLPEKSYDLLTAPLLLPHCTDLTATLRQWGKALVGDGLLLASTWGTESAPELRALGLDPTPLPTIQEVGDTLTRLRFALPVVDRNLLTLTFSSIDKINEKLSVWNIYPHKLDKAIEAAWRQQFPHPDGHLPLTLEVLTLTAWRPHHSQPQPLEPGQYKVQIGTLPEDV